MNEQPIPSVVPDNQMPSGGASPHTPRMGRGIAVAITVLLLLAVASMAVAWFVWSSVFLATRSDVTGHPTVGNNGMPTVSYASLYEEGSFEAKCYEAIAADLASGACPESWDVLSWNLLPAGEDGDASKRKLSATGAVTSGEGEDAPAEQGPAESDGGSGEPVATDTGEAEAGKGDAATDENGSSDESMSETLARIAKFVMLDNPQYASYLNGNMVFDTVGNRYRPRACSGVDSQDVLDGYANQQALVSTNYVSLQAMSEGSDSKYACVAYRFLCSTVTYDKTSEENNVEAALESHDTGSLGLALAMKSLLDAGGIPNYVAYGTFTDTGLPYTWNVAWLDDSWKVFDVPAGCQQTLAEDEEWTVNSNLASIPRIFDGCMVTPGEYAMRVTRDSVCTSLQLRYESLVASSMSADDGAGEVSGGEARAPSGPLTYRSLLDEAKQRFYDAVSEDLVSGRYIDSNNPESWFVSPVVIADDEECAAMTEVASCVMYDTPVLSVTNGGGGWSLRYWSKTSDFGYISRYFISSAISNSDGNIEMKMESTRNSAHTVYEKAQTASEGDERKFVYAAYREIAANCLYSDDVDDTIHHNDAYGALIEGESKCYGVSCAMKMVLDERGIPNFVAFGTMHGEGHAWNMVYLDGQWFACDLTAGSLMTAEEYANGTMNRDILYSGIDEMDTFYKKCLVPCDDFYDPSNDIFPSDLSVKLQESYGNDGNGDGGGEGSSEPAGDEQTAG